VKCIVNPSRQDWEDIIRRSEHSYFFHTPIWANILNKVYGFETATKLYEIEGIKVLIPIALKRRSVLSFYESTPLGYGGVFSTSQIPTTYLNCIFNHVVNGVGMRGILSMTVPPFYDLAIQNTSNIKEVDLHKWNYTHILSLEEGFDYIWKNKYDKKCRNAVRKAEKSSIKVVHEISLDNVKKFYSIYLNTVKRWGYKRPPHPWCLYKNFYILGSPYVQFRFALKDYEIIAALIDFRYNKNIFYWMSVFDEKYKSYSPINLLVTDSIGQACDEGYKHYNFGASGNLESVRRFKESFGAKKVRIKRYIVASKLNLAIYTTLSKILNI